MERVKRVVSLMLCLVMVFGLLPMSVFATDVETSASNEEVYVLVSSITEEGEYLIVSANEATDGANMLAAPSSGSKVENLGAVVETGVNTDGETVVYIADADENAVWTATANGSNWKLFNGETGRYLRYSNGLKAATSSTSWTADEDALYFAQTAMGETTNNYVRFKNAWGTQNSAAAVYVYQKQAVAFAEVEAPVENETVVEEEIIDEEIVDDEAVTVGDDGTLEDSTTKTVYVLSSLSEAGNYIIVNRNGSGNAKALEVGTTTGVDVTVNAAGNGVGAAYIDNADSSIVWEASKSGSYWNFKNGSSYLGRNNSNSLKADATSATNWTYSSSYNRLSFSSSWSSYYLYCDSSTWKVSTSTNSVYFYKENSVTYTVSVAPTITVAENGTAQINAVLQQNGADTTTALTYAVVSGDISVSDTGLITARSAGEAQVKVTYTIDGKTIGKIVTVNVEKPGYGIQISYNGDIVNDATINQRGATAGKTLTLGAKIVEIIPGVSSNEVTLEGAAVNWSIPEEEQGVATINKNGVVTFKGVNGVFHVYADLVVNGEVIGSAVVTISANTTAYTIPSESATDFPEYPAQGSIRFDKTAEVYGNSFSQTGMAQIELSMTGVPFKSHQTLDVVIMLDHSNSMTEARMDATREAVKVFVRNIVTNKDGSFNNNRIYIGSFMGGNPKETADRHKFRIIEITTPGQTEGGYQVIDSETELNALFDSVESKYYKYSSSTAAYGTEYDQSLEKCYNMLKDSKAAGNQQFCVFMSDGIPNVYRYGSATNAKTSTSEQMAAMFKGTNYDTRDTDYEYEYWSTLMKAEGVTVFTVGLGLYGTNSSLNGATAAQCENVANMLLNDISGPAGETTQPDQRNTKTLSKKDQYFFSVQDTNAATGMKDVFTNIADQITQAATDVVVTDKINDNYTVIFDAVKGDAGTISTVNNEKLYIEVVKYALNSSHDRESSTSLCKLYLKDSNGTYSAAKDANGTAADAIVFQAAAADKKAYWTIVDNGYVPSNNDIVVTIDGTTYKFVEEGTGTLNVVSGAFASGTIDETTNMSNDLVLVTPYFAYSAKTRMLAWTASELTDTHELALKYFVYLENSATEVGYDPEKEPGTYQTNDWAYITYTNFKGNDCRQEFPVPQMTWNGAQASYVFYLVNEQGEPINKSGQKVDFANATFVTDVFTEAVVWNKTGDGATGDVELNVQWLAQNQLPEGYTIYDPNAYYEIHVYEDSTGASDDKNPSWFVINGTAAGSITSTDTTKVYNTKAGTRYTKYGTYASAKKGDATVLDHFDFANTTVAFAVVWEAKLTPDTVVVDFGLDVLIDVITNDLVANKIDGISWTKGAYEGINENTVITTPSMSQDTVRNQNGDTISIENENQIRFKQGDMEFNEPVTFYYESAVKYYVDSDPWNCYMYSSVTVIPATTIYYEDDFIELSSYTWDENKNDWTSSSTSVWTQGGDTINATQAQDRPGSISLSAALDANNIYGYDQAYDVRSEYSMGSAKIATVDYNNYGAATFTFYGTGFDVISMTNSDTGTILVDIMDDEGQQVKDANGKPMSYAVDTYYGYKYTDCLVTYTYDERANKEQGAWILTGVREDTDPAKNSTDEPAEPKHGDTYVVERKDYVVDADAADTLYQVPVIKVDGLTYGQYTVTIKATYEPGFDHKDASFEGNYQFILDAVRIYDPTGNRNDTANEAYAKDGEFAPSYQEIRNNLIAAKSFDIANSEKVNGVMFIDGAGQIDIEHLTDYANYGPNNEVYLKKGQSIAFKIKAPTKDNLQLKNVHFGAKSADSSEVTYSVANIFNDEFKNEKTFTLKTSTDMYYDLTEWVGEAQVIVITNKSESILSLTNLKYTYCEKDSQIFARTTEVVEEVVEAYAYMTAADAEMVLRALNAPVVEETEPTVPETAPTEPEVTEPETTTPGSSSGENVVKTIIGLIGKLLGKIFG